MELTLSDGEATFKVQIIETAPGLWLPAAVLEVIDGGDYDTLFPVSIPRAPQPSPWLAFEPMVRVVATELLAIRT